MKYIDSEKLIAEIERGLSAHDKVDHLEAQEVGKAWNRGHRRALESILEIITSLQQEQQDHLPDAGKMVEQEHIADVSKMIEQHEVDLEKEIKAEWDVIDTDLLRFEEFKAVCYRIYELGLKAGKEE